MMAHSLGSAWGCAGGICKACLTTCTLCHHHTGTASKGHPSWMRTKPSGRRTVARLLDERGLALVVGALYAKIIYGCNFAEGHAKQWRACSTRAANGAGHRSARRLAFRILAFARGRMQLNCGALAR